MCEFHSFAWIEGRRFVEEPGVVHHSELLHRAGIDGDRAVWLDPEFDVRERIVHVCDIPLVSALGGSDYADVFLGQRALSRLERYLRKRFGTPKALTEFAKDYWDVARDQLEQVVIVPPIHAGQKRIERKLVAELTAQPGCNLIVSADWKRGAKATILWMRVDWDKADVAVEPGYRFSGADIVELWRGEEVCAILRTVSFVFIEERPVSLWPGGVPVFTFLELAGEVIQKLKPVVGVDRILVYRTPTIDGYHAWRDLFLDKRYRVRAWNEPFDFDRAIGLTEVAA